MISLYAIEYLREMVALTATNLLKPTSFVCLPASFSAVYLFLSTIYLFKSPWILKALK